MALKGRTLSNRMTSKSPFPRQGEPWDSLMDVVAGACAGVAWELEGFQEAISTGVVPTDLTARAKLVLELTKSMAGAAPPEVLSLARTLVLGLDSIATEIESTAEEYATVMASILPPHAPDLDNLSTTATGAEGYLTWDGSNPLASYEDHPDYLIDVLLNVGSIERGIFAATGSDLTGTLNDDVALTDNYPANSFGHADEGTLELILVDGSLAETVLHTVDLSTFSSGLTESGAGSGFTLSAIAPVTYASGDPFTPRQYRTGTWHVNRSDLNLGFNRVIVRHTQGDGTVVETNHFHFVLDGATNTASFSADSIDTISQPNTRWISGVQWNTSPVTMVYHLTIDDCYRNTYAKGDQAIYVPTSVSVGGSGDDWPASGGDQAKQVVLAKTLTITDNRVYDSGVGIQSMTPQRTVQTENAQGSTLEPGFLYDNVTTGDSPLDHGFNIETYRYSNDGDFNIDRSPDWDETQSLVGADAGHNNGLEYRDGKLDYPANNYSAATHAPGTAPNYFGASGERYCILEVTDTGGGQNFVLLIEGSATLVQDTGTLTPNSDEVAISVRFPTQTGWMDVTQAFLSGQWGSTSDAWNTAPTVGCYAATYGNDQTIPTTSPGLGITIGTKDAADSFDKFYLRIRVPAGWTGNLSRLRVTWGVT